MRHFFHSKAKLATLSAACGAGGAGAGAAAAQHPLLGLTCGAKGRKRIGDSVPSPLGVLLSLPLSCPRRSSATGHQIFLACGAAPTLGWPAAQKAESRASRSGTTPSFKWGGDLVLGLSSGVALLSRSPSRLLVGSSATKFSRPAAQHPAPIFGWPAAQKRQKAE